MVTWTVQRMLTGPRKAEKASSRPAYYALTSFRTYGLSLYHAAAPPHRIAQESRVISLSLSALQYLYGHASARTLYSARTPSSRMIVTSDGSV